MTGELDYIIFEGPFQPSLFYDSVILNHNKTPLTLNQRGICVLGVLIQMNPAGVKFRKIDHSLFYEI